MFCEMQLEFSGSDMVVQHHLILIERMLYVDKCKIPGKMTEKCAGVCTIEESTEMYFTVM